MTLDQIEEVTEALILQCKRTHDNDTLILLCKTIGLFIAAGGVLAQNNDTKISSKLERAAIATLLRGFGVKDASRGKR